MGADDLDLGVTGLGILAKIIKRRADLGDQGKAESRALTPDIVNQLADFGDLFDPGRRVLGRLGVFLGQ